MSAKKTIELPPAPKANDVRDAEAREVAEICAQLIGNMEVTTDSGSTRPLVPADIALLAPTGTQLHRYEHALDELGLPYASQAGKNLFERQEDIQDLVSLARTLADPLDTLAFGALMRGPLVGLTEEELLDITAQLPSNADKRDLAPRFSLLSDSGKRLASAREGNPHPAPGSMATRHFNKPDAPAERRHGAPSCASRTRFARGEQSDRALANIDVFLELARTYDVRGLKQFVRDVTRDWSQREPRAEGRVEAVGDAIEIVSIHSSKGLEWPVVVLINTITQFPSRGEFVHRPSDDTLHWVLGDVVPPDLNAALEKDGGPHESANASSTWHSRGLVTSSFSPRSLRRMPSPGRRSCRTPSGSARARCLNAPA